jgi:hypothetical protein
MPPARAGDAADQHPALPRRVAAGLCSPTANSSIGSKLMKAYEKAVFIVSVSIPAGQWPREKSDRLNKISANISIGEPR